jgi:peptidyl-prolyl cis-trans isomerase SurA
MKKIFTLILGLNFCFAYSQQDQDPIVMTIADIEVPLSEFLFLAQKDNGVNLLNKKSLENYIELFKTFKLKIADAKSLRIQESIRFKEELATYRSQLISSCLVDNEGEEKVVREVYERGKELLSLSHIIFLLPEQSLPKDTLEVFNKANEVYTRIKAGEDFTTVGKALSENENSGIVYEDIDYVFPLQAFREIEETIYPMSVNDISTPVRTPLGFHIIRLNQKIANTTSIQVAHILIQTSETTDPIEDAFFLKIANDVYEKAKKGEDFSELAIEYSDDENTKHNGGILPFFGIGNMVLPFEQAAFALKNIGDVSEPVRTRFGYHIIKLLEKRGYPSFEEMKGSLYATMKQGEWNHELVKAFD